MNVFDLSAKITMDINGYLKGMDTAKSVALSTMGVIGGAIGQFMEDSVKVGMGFDTAMSQVAATMGGTMQSLEAEVGSVDTAFGTFSGNLREYAQYMGANTAFSATQSAEALNYMALAGYDAQKSMEMLPNVMNLAAAGGFNLARASDMVTDTQTAFGITTGRTTQMVDEMAKAASSGNTSVEQLGDAFLVVGGLAKELNGGMVKLADGTEAEADGVQELEIALTAMANAGVKGSEAGTHMRNMLLKLASPTEDGAKRFTELGVSVFDAEGKMRSLKDIFGDLNVSLNKLTQEEKTQAIADIFNTRDIAAAEALLAATGEDWDIIGEKILDAEGAAQQMADVQLDNLEGDITLFNSALEGLQIALSDSATPALREFTQFGTTLIQSMTEGFQALPEPMQEVLGMLGLIGGKALEALPGIIGMSANMSILAKNVPAVGNALSKLKTFVMNPIFLGIAAGAAVAISMFVEIRQNIEKNTEALRKMKEEADSIKEGVSNASDALDELGEAENNTSDAANNLAKAQQALENIQRAQSESTHRSKDIVDSYTDSLEKTKETLEGGLGADIFTNIVALSSALGSVDEAQKQVKISAEKFAEAEAKANEEIQRAQNEVDKWTLLSSEMSEFQANATIETLNLADAQEMSADSYATVIDSITELNNTHNEYRGNIEASVEATRAAMEQLKADYEEARISAYESVSGIFEDFQKMPEIVTQAEMDTILALNEGNEAFDKSAYQVQMSVDDMIAALDSQAKYMDTYAENLKWAMEHGVDDGILKTLDDGSVESAATLQSIVDAGEDKINELNEKFRTVEKGKNDFADIVAGLETDFSDKMQEMVEDLEAAQAELDKADELYTSGMNSIVGYIRGATNDYIKQALYDSMYRMGQLSHAGFQAGIEEHSPSKLFMKSGVNSILGAIIGAESEKASLESTYENLAASAISAYESEMHDVSFSQPELNWQKSRPDLMAASIPREQRTETSQQPTYLVLDGQIIGRVLNPYISAEQQRIGVQIAGGIA